MIAITIELRELKEKRLATPCRSSLNIGDRVLVATDNGLEEGRVIEPEKVVDKEIEIKIVRRLNENDMRVLKENKEKAREVLPEIRREIEKEKLQMDLTYITYTYDRQKLYIYYTAEARVDFRKLIRVLGSRFKTRIQMVQIGVRDEASIVGGLGLCGREICCKGFLRKIESVNIDLARIQYSSINPENVTGCCGRLLCCVRYESEFYQEKHKKFPKVGKKVNTPEGRGEIIEVNYIKGTISIKLKTGAVRKLTYEELSSGVKDKFKKWIK
ncbi:stage 0 sporulation family protein [Elusimicrobiota bacterium]